MTSVNKKKKNEKKKPQRSHILFALVESLEKDTSSLRHQVKVWGRCGFEYWLVAGREEVNTTVEHKSETI